MDVLIDAIENIPAPASINCAKSSAADQISASAAIAHASKALREFSESAPTNRYLEVDLRQLPLRAPAIEMVTQAFRTKGYTATFRSERTPNGARLLVLVWD